MLRALVILLIGVLLGANIVYFAMTRTARQPAAHSDKGVLSVDDATPADARDSANVPVPAPSDADARAAPSGPPASGSVAGAEPVATTPLPDSATATAKDGGHAAPGPTGLIVPVSGVAAKALADTYTDARSEGRSHDAIDIMAPAGTPVLAVAGGHVEKLFTSDRGGLTIYQFEPGGRYAYYYAHLQSYAPGLREQQQVRAGDVLGYVGSTGNASADAPHLHFAIFVLGPEKQWWKGTAINPYPLLGGKPR